MRDELMIVQMLKKLHDRVNDIDYNSYDNTVLQFFESPNETTTLIAQPSVVITDPTKFSWGSYGGFTNGTGNNADTSITGTNLSVLNINTAITVEATILPQSYGYYPNIICNSDINAGYYLSLGNNDGSICVYTRNNNVFFQTSKSYVSLNAVTTIAFTYTVSGQIYIYVNGMLVETSPAAPINPSGVIGTFTPFIGDIKSLRIYNTALSNEQIAENFAGNVRNGITGEWLLNEGSGTVVHDTSGNANDGTIISGSLSPNIAAGWYWGIGGKYS